MRDFRTWEEYCLTKKITPFSCPIPYDLFIGIQHKFVQKWDVEISEKFQWESCWSCKKIQITLLNFVKIQNLLYQNRKVWCIYTCHWNHNRNTCWHRIPEISIWKYSRNEYIQWILTILKWHYASSSKAQCHKPGMLY